MKIEDVKTPGLYIVHGPDGQLVAAEIIHLAGEIRLVNASGFHFRVLDLKNKQLEITPVTFEVLQNLLATNRH